MMCQVMIYVVMLVLKITLVSCYAIEESTTSTAVKSDWMYDTRDMQNYEETQRIFEDMKKYDLDSKLKDFNDLHSEFKNLPDLDDFKVPDLNEIHVKFEDLNTRNNNRLNSLEMALFLRVALYVVVALLVIGVSICIKCCCPNRCRKQNQGHIIMNQNSLVNPDDQHKLIDVTRPQEQDIKIV